CEPFEQRDRLDREPDVRLVRELMADAAGVAAGGSGAEHLLALDHDDVGDPNAGEVVGDRRAHAPTADHDDVSRSLHPVKCGSRRGRAESAALRAGPAFQAGRTPTYFARGRRIWPLAYCSMAWPIQPIVRPSANRTSGDPAGSR